MYEIKGGVEHRVFHVPGPTPERDYAIKVTEPPTERWNKNGYGLSADAIAYLTRLDKMNRLAPALDYRVLGVTPTIAPERAWPSLVTRMTWFHGDEPAGGELHAFLAIRGFQDRGLNVWEHSSGLTLGDVHTGNFIVASEGLMIPIDVTVDGPVPAPLLAT
jgi:hypothetical protein